MFTNILLKCLPITEMFTNVYQLLKCLPIYDHFKKFLQRIILLQFSAMGNFGLVDVVYLISYKSFRALFKCSRTKFVAIILALSVFLMRFFA